MGYPKNWGGGDIVQEEPELNREYEEDSDSSLDYRVITTGSEEEAHYEADNEAPPGHLEEATHALPAASFLTSSLPHLCHGSLNSPGHLWHQSLSSLPHLCHRSLNSQGHLCLHSFHYACQNPPHLVWLLNYHLNKEPI